MALATELNIAEIQMDAFLKDIKYFDDGGKFTKEQQALIHKRWGKGAITVKGLKTLILKHNKVAKKTAKREGKQREAEAKKGVRLALKQEKAQLRLDKRDAEQNLLTAHGAIPTGRKNVQVKQMNERLGGGINSRKDVVSRLADKHTYVVTVTYTPYKLNYKKSGEPFLRKEKPMTDVRYSKAKLEVPYSTVIKDGDYTTLVDNLWSELHPNSPVVKSKEGDLFNSLGKKAQEHYVVLVSDIRIKNTLLTKARILELKDAKLYFSTMCIGIAGFNGFRDKGERKCVPEVLHHHLHTVCDKRRLTEAEVVDGLFENRPKLKRPKVFEREVLEYTGDSPNPMMDGLEDGGLIHECERPYIGYSAETISNYLTSIGVPFKLLDFQQKIFLQNVKRSSGKHKPFVAICYNNHLYYCTDDDYIQRLGNIRENSCLFAKQESKEKTKFETRDAESLTEEYLEAVERDNVIYKAKLYNGEVVSYIKDGLKVVACQNPETCQALKGEEWSGQNIQSIMREKFESAFPEHLQSTFIPHVFEQVCLQKCPQLVETFKTQKGGFAIDINKCRTDCLMNNRLGAYALFGINDKVEAFGGSYSKAGWYWAENIEHPVLRSCGGWLSNEFLHYLNSRGVAFKITAQFLASATHPEDYFKKFCEDIVSATGDYKFAINSFIGSLGQTMTTTYSGYIEADFDVARWKFWNSNEGVGSGIIDVVGNRLKEGEWTDIISMSAGAKELYGVQTQKQKTCYSNNLSFYNKVIENEWMRVMELVDLAPDKVVAIRTDCVVFTEVVEAEFTDAIGGWKEENKEGASFTKRGAKEEREAKFEVEGELVWEETLDGSYLIDARAGYGKTHYIKQNFDMEDEGILKLAWSHRASLNLNGQTICKGLQVDFVKKKFGNKDLTKYHTVIVDEVYTVPTYIIARLCQIKRDFPHLRFILAGDPNQTRPVGEENTELENSPAIHHLVDGRRYTGLKENWRNDFTEEEYIAMGTGRWKATWSTDEWPLVNICKFNRTRVKINETLMCRLRGGAYREGAYREVAHDEKNEKGQAISLFVGLKVMCLVNDESRGLINTLQGEVLVVEDGRCHVLFDDATETCEFTDAELARDLVPSYAFTNHKVQGITIEGEYRVHDWERMSGREQYTALSRAQSREMVTVAK